MITHRWILPALLCAFCTSAPSAFSQVTQEDILFLKRTGIDEKVLENYIAMNGGAAALTEEDEAEIRAAETAASAPAVWTGGPSAGGERPAVAEPNAPRPDDTSVRGQQAAPPQEHDAAKTPPPPASVPAPSRCPDTTVAVSAIPAPPAVSATFFYISTTTIVQAATSCAPGPVSVPALCSSRNGCPYFPASQVLSQPYACPAPTVVCPLPTFGTCAAPAMGTGYPGLYNTQYQPALLPAVLR